MDLFEEQCNRFESLHKMFKTKMWVAGAIENDLSTLQLPEHLSLKLNIRHKSVMDEVDEVLDEMRRQLKLMEVA